jgi:hypothetical protein
VNIGNKVLVNICNPHKKVIMNICSPLSPLSPGISGILKYTEPINSHPGILLICHIPSIYYTILYYFLLSDAKDGVYKIKTDTTSNHTSVYCQITSLVGCAGGGWTMVMKINGSKASFFSWDHHIYIHTSVYIARIWWLEWTW